MENNMELLENDTSTRNTVGCYSDLQPDDEIELPDLGFLEATGMISVIKYGITELY